MLTLQILFVVCPVGLLCAQHPSEPPVRPHRSFNSSAAFNLDFENNFNGAPVAWSFVNGTFTEYQQALDTTVVYSGSQSLRITSANAPLSDKAYSYQQIPASLINGQTIHMSGAIRTQKYATIFMEVDAPSGNNAVNLVPERQRVQPIGGFTHWLRRSPRT